MWTAKAALSGQLTRLKASATSLGIENKSMRMADNFQILLTSGEVIATNQIGFMMAISKETFLKFTKNTRLSMMVAW